MAASVARYAIFSLSFILAYILVQGQRDITELPLPHCIENNDPGLVLVSTLDGKVSALNTAGILLWQIDTGPGPLLTSNIHELELGRDDEWTRIIPSLSGGLYKFTGAELDAMPVTAETLLKSSFRYSDEIVMAGGLEVRTYGVALNSGKCLYVCSPQSCKNTTDELDADGFLAVIERSTRTVRAIEAKSGAEKWNFSVGTHDIKIPQMECMNSRINYEFNISAVLPKGKLNVGVKREGDYFSWAYEFTSPIVDIWNFNGRELNVVDVFKSDIEQSRAIYLGMHNKQLYIHESASLQTALQTQPSSVELSNLKIPWKPIKAGDTALVPLGSDVTTALSVLYGSEYANGNGYYLYTEVVEETEKCHDESSNKTKVIPIVEAPDESFVITSIWYWWKEVLLISITTAVAFNVMFRSFSRNRQPQEKIIFVDRPVPSESSSNGRTISESSENSFTSRFTNDFETVSCLGKGGFGIVFKVRQKIDECNYAIKRITLPERQKSRERVMREVKALAKLDHQNIVRYYNSWVEAPPAGWHREHDNKWLSEANLSYFATNSVFTTSHKRSNSVAITVNHSTDDIPSKECTDSYIVFEASNKNETTTNTTTSITSTHMVSESEHSRKKINWKRPSRRPHSLDLTRSQSITLPELPCPVFLYIQMQLCREESLKDWLNENKKRDFGVILDIFRQILSAVEYVHLQGLIHRDLKPSNIFFSLEGQVKVGDFGLVTDMGETPENEYSVVTLSPKGHTKAVGTRLYMSPEQFMNKSYNYKVDIFSLGLIFFELLVPFSTDMERVATLSNVREKQYPPDFKTKFCKEYELLNMMLCDNPEKRLTTIGIRARAPINNGTSDFSKEHHFNLPISKRSSELFA